MKKLFTLAAAVLASVSLSWANQTDLVSGVTLPDMPSASLDLTSQTTFTPDGDGWVVFDPYADAANLSTIPSWWKHTAKSGQSENVTADAIKDMTAPFFAKTSTNFKVNFDSNNAGAIRFTGATEASFLVNPRSTKAFYVGLFTYDGDKQTLVEEKSVNVNSYQEILYSSLNASTTYVAYFYGKVKQNLVIAEIALKGPAPEAICPSGLSISGGKMYAEGTKIELTASLEAGNGAITYQWYKGSVAEANKIAGATAAKLEIANCTVSNSGDYFCVASKAACEDAVNAEAYTISVKDPAAVYGEIITATLTSGTAATVTGAIGGTADVSLSTNLKMDKNKYFGIALGIGNFKEGDTVVITMTTAGGNYPCLFSDKERTNCLYLATASSSDLVYKIVLPAAANSVNTLYLSRGDDTDNYKWNPVLSSMSVVRPVAVKSTVETLTGVSINDEAISEANLAKLLTNKVITLDEKSYVNAPVVKFTKHVVTTYEDESVKESDDVIEKTSSVASVLWGATATIGGTEYIVYTAKQLSYVVTYKRGEETLGSENVAQNGSPANYATYQTLSLATFEGWYSNSDLAEEHKVANIAAEVITANKTYYGKWTYKHATSINIEKLVLDNGKSYDIMSALGSQNYASNIQINDNNALDSLADKDNRNYEYLGLKVKESGKLLNFRVANGQTVKVKFGALKMTPQVSVNGAAYAAMTITDNAYSYTATGEDLVSIYINEANKAVVFKQIVIGAAPEFEFVMGTVAVAATEHGTVVVDSPRDNMALVGETVTLTVTPESGYLIASVTVDSNPLEAVDDVYSFVMPAKNVEVAATFSKATAIDNLNDNTKAVKTIENGQLVIIKNGVKYNAQGAIVK